MGNSHESYGKNRQKQIFLNNLSGKDRAIPIAPDKLKKKARKKLSARAYAYIAGSAGKEETKAGNRSAFKKWQIVPSMLRNVSSTDTGISLFGHHYSSPFMLAPIGVLEMAHRQADLAVAKAAAQEQVPMIFSSQASVPMEETAGAMGDSPRWFQLYWSTSNDLVESFVQRAEQSACQAIVLTLDTTLLGWRPRDLDLDYLPFLRGKGIAQYSSDPVFKQLMEEKSKSSDSEDSPSVSWNGIKALIQMAKNYPGRFWSNLFSKEPRKAVKTFIESYSRPSLQWDDLQFLRSLTDLPIILKGILNPEDAQKAVEADMDGIIVSNHGGRQVDGAISSLGALSSISKATDGRIPILLDSGIRTGADIFKALALGADAVLLGRPYAYALAVAGQQGVEEYIRNVRADFQLTMALSGYRSISEVSKSSLKQAG